MSCFDHFLSVPDIYAVRKRLGLSLGIQQGAIYGIDTFRRLRSSNRLNALSLVDVVHAECAAFGPVRENIDNRYIRIENGCVMGEPCCYSARLVLENLALLAVSRFALTCTAEFVIQSRFRTPV